MAEEYPQIEKFIKILQWVIVASVLIMGAYISFGGKTKWMIIGGVIHSLPLIAMFIPYKKIKNAILWFGVFLLFQDVYSLNIAKADLYKTLPANMNDQFEVKSEFLKGIDGVQQITTDDKGFRVTKAINYHEDNTYRIFIIGASTSEQIYLDDKSTWTHLLQEDLDVDVEVINTGVSGLRAEHHLETLKNILNFNPDMILFLVGVNDWNKHIRENFGSLHYKNNKFKHSLTVKFIRENIKAIKSKQKKKKQKKIKAQNKAKNKIRIEDGDFYKEKMGSLINRETKKSWDPKSVDPHYARTLKKISALCKSQKHKCVFISQPHGYQTDISEDFKAHFWMTPPGEDYSLDLKSLNKTASLYNNWLNEFACQESQYFIDLAAAMPASFESFYDDVHFNESGASKVASIISPEIKNMISSKEPEPCQ